MSENGISGIRESSPPVSIEWDIEKEISGPVSELASSPPPRKSSEVTDYGWTCLCQQGERESIGLATNIRANRLSWPLKRSHTGTVHRRCCLKYYLEVQSTLTDKACAEWTSEGRMGEGALSGQVGISIIFFRNCSWRTRKGRVLKILCVWGSQPETSSSSRMNQYRTAIVSDVQNCVISPNSLFSWA